jgi:hypothetical protein
MPLCRVFVVLALALVTFSVGCTRQMRAWAQYSEDVDFAQYQTYRWVTDDLVLIQTGSGDPAIRTIENEKRIRAAVDRELAAKGLEKVEGDDAQLAVAFTVGTKVRYKLSGAGGNEFDIITSEADSVTRGTLTMYVFDRARQEQIWSAWTKKDLEPGTDPDAVIDAAVAVLMDEFPDRSPSAHY